MRPRSAAKSAGAALIQRGVLCQALGGTELFVAVERLTDRTLPADLSGSIEVAPGNAPFGFRPVYFFGRRRNDSKVWSSAQFITFAAP
jgi:hypothetical protein